MECTSCGGTIRDTAKVCGYCGRTLVKQPAAAPSPVEPTESVAEQTLGKTLEVAAVENRPPPAPPKASPPARDKPGRLRWVVLGLAVLIAVAAGIGAMYMAGAPSGDTAEPTAGTAEPPLPGDDTAVEDTGEAASETDATTVERAPSVNTEATIESSFDAPEPAPAASPQPPFVGGWTTVDTDGSTMWLWIDSTGDPSEFRVRLYDEGASGCDKSMTVPALMDDIGNSVEPATVQMIGASVSCILPDGSMAEINSDLQWSFRYDHAENGIEDSFHQLLWESTIVNPESALGG